MHFFKKLCVATAVFGLGAGAQAQSSATDPIFVQRLPILAGADTHMAISADTVSIYRGVIELSENGTLTLAHAPQWQANALAGEQPYQLVVLSGQLEGASFEVVGNSATAVSIDAGDYDLSNLVEGDLVQIQPAWTLNDVAQLGDLPEGAQLILLGRDAQTGAARNRIFSLFADYGWMGANFTPSSTVPVQRGEGFIVRLPSQVDDSELVMIGQVPLSAQRTTFAVAASQQTTDYRFALLSAEPALLDEIYFGGEVQLLVYDNSVAQVNKRPSAIYTYFEGWGWYGNGFEEVGSSVVLEPGQSYLIKHYNDGAAHMRELVWLPSYLD